MFHVNGKDLAVIIVDRGMVEDHLPNNVLAALKRCQRELRVVCKNKQTTGGAANGAGVANGGGGEVVSGHEYYRDTSGKEELEMRGSSVEEERTKNMTVAVDIERTYL